MQRANQTGYNGPHYLRGRGNVRKSKREMPLCLDNRKEHNIQVWRLRGQIDALLFGISECIRRSGMYHDSMELEQLKIFFAERVSLLKTRLKENYQFEYKRDVGEEKRLLGAKRPSRRNNHYEKN